MLILNHCLKKRRNPELPPSSCVHQFPYPNSCHTLKFLSVVLMGAMLTGWFASVLAGTDCAIQDEIPTAECETLLGLYESTDGSNWHDSPNNQWGLTNTPCLWTGVTCQNGQVTEIAREAEGLVGELPDLSALSRLERLILSRNQLSGSIPNLSQFANLAILKLSNNQLSGEIPYSLVELRNQLIELDLVYNQLTTNDLALQTFLNTINPDWVNTQTIPPTEVVATALSATTVEVNWTAIPYTADGGYYQVKYATSKGGAYTPAATTTADKQATRYVVADLLPNTPYYFVVETYTPTHGDQQNPLTSQFSAEAEATTSQPAGPRYSSTPEPNSLLDMGRSELGNPSTIARVTILEIGEDTLEVFDSEISGDHASDFQIVSGAAPFSLLDGSSAHPLLVRCRPSEVGQRTARLTLQTNDPAYLSVSYALTCEGEKGEPAYDSIPAPDSMLTVALDELGNPTSTHLTVLEVGNDTLEVTAAALTGPQASDFRLSSGAPPFSLADGSSPHHLFVQCTPSDVGKRTALLTLTTNDPNQRAVQYPLSCGNAVGPVYDSVPAPNSQLVVGTSQVGSPVTTSLTILEKGDDTLQVTASSLTGSHASDFSLSSGAPPVSIADGGAAHTLIVACLPSEVGQRTALLTLTTNDPKNETVTYSLTCEGEDNVEVGAAVFEGQIRTQAGVIGQNISIDEPEPFQLLGRIQPASSHIGQLADIVMVYQWQPDNDGNLLIVPVTVASQITLATQMETTLFEGTVVGLAGVFQVDLGYQLQNGERVFDQIATLTVRANRAPTDLILDGNTVAENSPPDTLIGTFTTLDADNSERFIYGLTDNPNKHFKVVGNELRVGNGFPLDFETESQHPITVRSVDTTGDYVEKSVTIRVTDVGPTPEEIHLTHDEVPEQRVDDTIVGRFWTEDREGGTYGYELLDNAQGRFWIDGDLLRVTDGKRLDFETQPRHDITVRSKAVETGGEIEKTVTIEVVNVVDVTVEGEVRDATNTVIQRPLHASDAVTIRVQLIPDIEHQGLEADIVVVAIVQGEGIDTAFAFDGNGWQNWPGDLATLPRVKRLTLQNSHQVLLFQGQLTGFAGNTVKIYVGYYLLETGELIYRLKSIDIEVI